MVVNYYIQEKYDFRYLVIKITAINENILKSYLTDFRDKYVKEDTENFNLFIEEFINLYNNDTKYANNNRALEHDNDEIRNYITCLKDKLSTLVIENQKILEQYNNLLDENRRLNEIKINTHTRNNERIDEITGYHQQINEYNKKILVLKKDIKYYKDILENLSLITNSYDNNNINLDEEIKSPSITISPYYRLIKNSGQFDREYYIRNYLDEYDDTDINPLEHFIEVGSKLDYNPNADFNTKWYRRIYLENSYDVNPFVEYLEYGINEDRLTSPPYNNQLKVDITQSQEYLLIDESEYFDKEYYQSQYDIKEDVDVVRDYLENYQTRSNPCRQFDALWYNSTYLEYYDVNPLLDYITHYDTHLISKPVNEYNNMPQVRIEESQLYQSIHESKLLNDTWYTEEYDTGNTDNITHFITEGYNKGYTLNEDIENIKKGDIWQYLLDNTEDDTFNYESIPALDVKDSREYNILSEDTLFDIEYYLRCNNDVKEANVDPISHYLTNGYKEGRNPSQEFNSNDYLRKHPHITINPLIDYIMHDKLEYIRTSTQVDEVQIQDTQEYAILDKLEYFDRQYYLDRNHDVKVNKVDALEHFIKYGQYEGRNPTANIDIQYLTQQNESTKQYLDYILETCQEESVKFTSPFADKQYKENYQLLSDTKYFNRQYYIRNNPNITENDDPIDYYLTRGRYEEYPTSKYFSPKEYLEYNKDLKNLNVDPLIHFIKSGLREQRRYKRPKLTRKDFKDYPEDFYEKYSLIYDSNIFDEEYYNRKYPEIVEEDQDPIIDYLTNGVKYSRNPSATFSTQRYLKYHGDIRRTGFNPLYHYLTNGKKENRFIYLPNEYFIHNIMERYEYLQTHRILEELKTRKTLILEYNEDTEYSKRIITSIIENTTLSIELIIISQTQIDPSIQELEQSPNIQVIKTDNIKEEITRILDSTENDVVIIDKNTVLTPHWLSKLVISAYKDDRIATVSTLTNKSDLLTHENSKLLTDSIQISGNLNNLNDLSKKIEVKFNDNNTSMTHSENYCTYIKRQALEELENINYTTASELSYQLYNKGWINIQDNSTFTYTLEKVEDNIELDNESQDKLNNSIEVTRINKLLGQMNLWNKDIHKRRILVFTQLDENQQVILDKKVDLLSRIYDVYVLALDYEKYYIYRYHDNILSLIDNYTVDYSFTSNFYEKTYFNIITNLKIDLLYTKHFKQLYHPTNRKFTSIIEIIKYLEVEEIHESVYQMLDVKDEIEKIFYKRYDYEECTDRYIKQLDFTDKKVVVYTAVTGDYDEPIIPSYVNEDFDYICFTDNPRLKSDFWTIRLMQEENTDNIRMVRKYKILPHKYLSEYDYSIWIDTNFEITADLKDYIHRYSNDNKLLAIRHEFRDCLYEEADACINSNKDSQDTITKQMDKYKLEGYPEHYGLIASGILFRNHHDEEVINVMQDWYSQLEQYSYRDQLSFNYACYKNNFHYDEARIFYLKNSYFQRHDHIKNGFALRIADVSYNRDYDLQLQPETIDEILEAFQKTTTIIMPIISDAEQLHESIESIHETTNIDYELILINDNLNDEEIENLLHSYSQEDNITVINNNESLGYVQNINQAINKSTADIVIVDSNNIFTDKWLHKLKIKAYSNSEFGSVTTLFNRTRHYNLSNDDNYINKNLRQIANNIEKKSQNRQLIIPASDIKCMYIKREAIYKTGFFDINFTREYAAIDYSRRLLNRGWKNTLDTSTFIYNSSTTMENMDDKNRIIRQYPEYKVLEEEYINSIELNQLTRHIKYGLKSNNNRNKAILYALHGGIGGTLHTSIELIKHIDKQLDTYLLITSTDKIELYKYSKMDEENYTLQEEEFKQQLNLLRVWKIKSKYTLLETTRRENKWIYFNLLMYLNIDIIHIRHLVKSSLDLPYIAGYTATPLVLSFHDFYYICPSHNLIDDNRKYCAGICPPLYEKSALGGQCNIIGELNIPPARTIVQWWREIIHEMFQNVDTFVTTSQSTYDLYTKFYPELKQKDFRIIEHGRDVKTPDKIDQSHKPDNTEKIRIVFPGHLSHTKGYELIKALKKEDRDDLLEFYYMGSLGGHDDLADVGVDLGTYNRSDFNRIIHNINPHFIAIFSIWPETYCHTLTEGWSSGVPIIALDMGAVGERIKREGGGYLVENNPQKAYRQIIEYATDTTEYERKKEEITRINFKTTKEMGQEYLEIYKKYLKELN